MNIPKNLKFKTHNVIEDIKLLNEKETLSGYVPIEKCLDTSNFFLLQELKKIKKEYLILG
jgi:hypothetical protein